MLKFLLNRDEQNKSVMSWKPPSPLPYMIIEGFGPTVEILTKLSKKRSVEVPTASYVAIGVIKASFTHFRIIINISIEM